MEIKLPENPKVWLCGVTGDRGRDIDELTKDIYQYFDGLIWTDHFSKDNTAKILEERKGNGKIVYRKYTQDHDMQRNEFLRCGVMKNFDYYVYIDSGERLDVEWCKNLRQTVKEYQNEGIGIGMIGRPYLLQYYDDQIFVGNPHCWPQPLRGRQVELNPNILSKKIMDEKSGLLHPFTYFWVNGRSNECQIMYGKYGQDIVNFHENLRIQMRWYWQQNMNREFTLESVYKYLNGIYSEKFKIDPFFLQYMELEWRFADFFRLKILKQRFMEDIVPNRYGWSFLEWFKTGDEKQINTTNQGTILKYNKQFNIKGDY